MSAELQRKLDSVPKQSRTVHVFDLPESVPGDIKQVSIVELTAQEELLASKRAGGDPFRIAYELAKQALVEINGEKVGLADGSADAVWAKMHPVVRELVVKAHQSTHNATEEQTRDFLQSRKVRVD